MAHVSSVRVRTRPVRTGERPVAPVYEDGEKTVTLKGDRIAEEFQELVERYVQRTFAKIAG